MNLDFKRLTRNHFYYKVNYLWIFLQIFFHRRAAIMDWPPCLVAACSRFDRFRDKRLHPPLASAASRGWRWLRRSRPCRRRRTIRRTVPTARKCGGCGGSWIGKARNCKNCPSSSICFFLCRINCTGRIVISLKKVLSGNSSDSSILLVLVNQFKRTGY